ncbi:MAG: DUF3108 domain-containing protein [Lysobacter sp.]|nr:DUF3108 domain-containing protein [Lysobacter sp.]
MRLLAFAVAFASLAAAAAPALPTEIAAEYRISTAGVAIGHVQETYVRTGDTYRIESTTRAEGVFRLFRDDTIVLSSAGRLGPKGLQPLRFEQRRLGDSSRDIVADFDWGKAQLRSVYRGEESVNALPPGTQDRLSVLYQFMHVRQAGEVVKMHMSNGRKVELYAYRKVGTPTIDTPAGEFATLHYERITGSEKENRAQLWLARDRFSLPVRIVFEDSKGLRLEQNLVSLTTR